MELQARLRRQVPLPGKRIVLIHLAQLLQHVAALLGERLGYINELTPAVGRAVATLVLSSAGRLCDRASHIWMGGPSVEARWAGI